MVSQLAKRTNATPKGLTYLEDLRPVNRDSTISCQSLVYLTHQHDHSRVERRLPRGQHVSVCHCFVILLLLMCLEQLLGLLLSILVAVDVYQSLLGIILPAVEDEPPRALWQPADDQEEQGGIRLHDHNGSPPGPLVRLSERVSHGNVYGEGHV